MTIVMMTTIANYLWRPFAREQQQQRAILSALACGISSGSSDGPWLETRYKTSDLWWTWFSQALPRILRESSWMPNWFWVELRAVYPKLSTVDSVCPCNQGTEVGIQGKCCIAAELESRWDQQALSQEAPQGQGVHLVNTLERIVNALKILLALWRHEDRKR